MDLVFFVEAHHHHQEAGPIAPPSHQALTRRGFLGVGAGVGAALFLPNAPAIAAPGDPFDEIAIACTSNATEARAVILRLRTDAANDPALNEALRVAEPGVQRALQIHSSGTVEERVSKALNDPDVGVSSPVRAITTALLGRTDRALATFPFTFGLDWTAIAANPEAIA